MKYVYCENCDRAYVKSRLERGKCIYCGKGAETVEVKRIRTYYIGYVIMIIGAALMVTIRFLFFNIWLLWAVGIAFIVAGGYLILKANGEMAAEAKRLAKQDSVGWTLSKSP